MQANLERLKQQLSKHFTGVVSSLVVMLMLLLYLTSLLSQSTVLSNTLVDLLIYLIYFALIFTLGTLAFVVYNYYDEESLLRSIDMYETTPKMMPILSDVKVEEDSGILLDVEWIIEQYQVKQAYRSGSDFKGLERFRALSPTIMLPYLEQQHPQLIVLILAYLSTKKGAELVSMFSPEMRENILTVFQTSKAVDLSTLLILDKALYRDLSTLKKECGVLNALSPLQVQNMLRQVSKTELMFALKGASQELQEMFLVNMSSKASKEFQSVLAKKRDVSPVKSDNALKNLYLLAQRLREDGKIRAT